MSGYSIQGGSENPTIDYVVTDVVTGAPMRVTIATGVMALVFDHGMLRVPPIPTPSAVVTAELFLSQVGIYDSKGVSSMHMHGVGDVQDRVTVNQPHG